MAWSREDGWICACGKRLKFFSDVRKHCTSPAHEPRKNEG